MATKKKILFAVLNWGLGHATRSCELIHNYIKKGDEVILASDGVAKDFLRLEFPNLKIHELPSYNAKYGNKGGLFAMMKNGFKTQLAVKKEKAWLNSFLDSNSIDLIVSDNRYGIYNDSIKSVIITHQLNIKSPFATRIVNAQNHAWLDNFDEIWVPDTKSELSGDLSKLIPEKIRRKVKEIGWLSRFKVFDLTKSEEIILAIVSGPEPQKSILSNKLEELLMTLDYKAVLYTGKPGGVEHVSKDNLTIKSHAISNEFAKDLARAKVVISRSGYSSIMDYKVFNKNVILIPTPGQDEQLYLGEYLNENPNFKLIQQEELNFESLKSLIN